MKHFFARYYVLVILIIIFAAPGFVAMYVYKNPDILGTVGTNKGQMLKPAIRMDELKQADKWHLVYWNPGFCGVDCELKLEQLAKIRLALGRKLYQVELNLNLQEATAQSLRLDALLKEADIKRMNQPIRLPGHEPAIFIANPDGYLVLSYAANTLPKDIFHDLKLLVNNTEQGSAQ